MPLQPFSSLPLSMFAHPLLPLPFSPPKDRQPVTVQKCLKTINPSQRKLPSSQAWQTGLLQPPPGFYWEKLLIIGSKVGPWVRSGNGAQSVAGPWDEAVNSRRETQMIYAPCTQLGD